jgi:hypothetical protein
MGLAVPVLYSQIETAGRLHERLQSWRETDKSLKLLAAKLPGHSVEEVLAKAATINQLYGTNVYAIWKMAVHSATVLSSSREVDVALVDSIAAFSGRMYVSFASKYCHFFLPGGEHVFPIFDSYAQKTLSYHLGRSIPSGYQTYVAAFEEVRTSFDLLCSNRELDRYLWLAGLYRAKVLNPAARINVEAAGLFDSAEVREDLAQLCPDLPDSHSHH